MGTNGRAKPMPYQKEGVVDIEEFLEYGGGALLADEMGLGKTLQALWTMRRERIETFPAVVVCPAAVKYGWEHEAMTHVNLMGQVCEGRKPPTGKMIKEPPRLTIINYDILPQWVRYLRQLKPKMVVLDECQYLQNRGAKRTKAAMQLCRGVPHRLAMSGTPLTNRPSELWPTLNILRPDLYPAFFTFAQEYCQPRKAPWGWEFKGAENLDKLHARLRRHMMVRRLKADVLHDLPEKLRRVVPMEIRNRAQYDHANNDFRGWLKQNKGARFMRATRAEKLAKIGYLLRLAARLKLRAVVDWTNRFLEESNEKLVLFAIHQKMIEALHRRVEAPSVVVNGSVTGRHRKAAVDRFRNDPSCRVFIANIKAAGTGVDGLQDTCSTMAFAEMWWRPGDHVQAEDRLHRIGQHDVSWINYLVAGDTIEEKLCRIIQEKQTVFRAALDGGRAPDGDLDVLDQLLAAMGAEV